MNSVDAARVRGLVESNRLSRWMDEQSLPGTGEQVNVEVIPGGTSNEMFRVRRASHEWVLRRPPRQIPEGRNEVMRREYGILRALAGTEVPHPVVRGFCDDQTVLGANFYLMDMIDGWSPIGARLWPSPFDRDMSARRDLAFALIDGIAQLSQVDWRERGLSGLGRPDGFHDRQVGRWMTHLRKCGGRQLPHIEAIAEWLSRRRPENYRAGLMHGDYQLSNVMFAHRSPAKLVAIIDWEMATIGDPLLDLGWVLAYWPDPGESPPRHPYVDLTEMPTHAELGAHYEECTGRRVQDLDYYVVLARFKLAIVLEAGYQRLLRRQADNPRMGRFGGMVVDLAEKAAERARVGSPSNT
jgi:aminoglycoside phosphotransferase (APT) family kinase protein